MTIIGKSRLNRHRCEFCGYPIKRGKECRKTGVDMADCAQRAVPPALLRVKGSK